MPTPSPRTAIIGSGISGLAAAYLLHEGHDITVYEKNNYIGGHARTRTIQYRDRLIDVDTGFIVFNKTNYPNLTALFRHLNVPIQKSVMSFGVKVADDYLEWGAENLNALFGQRQNLVRPAFYKFLYDVLKFNNSAGHEMRKIPGASLGELITHMKLGDWFCRYYILPMGGAIWSCSLEAMLSFPAKFFIEFFESHGLLTVTNQPQWFTVSGGSRAYLEKLTSAFKDKIKTSCGVISVIRDDDKVRVVDEHGNEEVFDQVVFACHANEALSMLADPTVEERKALAAFSYQKNTIILHKDVSVMPRRRSCWASWVYHADNLPSQDPIAVTYWMNHLQGIDDQYPLFVTLNAGQEILEEDIFERHEFEHPVYTPAAVEAQGLFASFQGAKRTWYCGAYHLNGFHEDGIASALNIAACMGVKAQWE